MNNAASVCVSLPIAAQKRPSTRGDCPANRPCPWVGCQYHLYLDIHPQTGALLLNFPEREPWELTATCALDIADQVVGQDRLALQEISELMNIDREAVRRYEKRALIALREQWGQLR